MENIKLNNEKNIFETKKLDFEPIEVSIIHFPKIDMFTTSGEFDKFPDYEGERV